MKRPHFHPSHCKLCGGTNPDGTPISQTGLCIAHSHERFHENLDAMKTMRGPFARHWRERMAASVGAVLLDDERRTA